MPDAQNGNNFGNVFTDRAQYDAAMAEWSRKKAAGDPFPGPMPRLDVAGQVNDRLQQVGFPSQIRNAGFYQDLAQTRAGAPERENPYNTVIADRSRQAQLALMDQMRAGLNGSSLAMMQGQRAFGQNGQAALGAAAMGGANPRAAMLQAQQVGGGLAGDLGQARLAEVMRQQATLGGAAGNLRGGDLRSAGVQLETGLRQRQQDDAMRQFYASQGAALVDAQGRLTLEGEKLRQRLALQAKKNDMDKVDAGVGMAGNVAAGFLR